MMEVLSENERRDWFKKIKEIDDRQLTEEEKKMWSEQLVLMKEEFKKWERDFTIEFLCFVKFHYPGVFDDYDNYLRGN